MGQYPAISKQLPQPRKLDDVINGLLEPHRERIYNELRNMGAVRYDLLLPETHTLPIIIQPKEHVTGVVYGRYTMTSNGQVGRGALVATDKRLLLVDKKFLFLRCDEFGFGSVSGITFSRVGYIGTVVLHTRLGDIQLRTLNFACAKHFVESVEKVISMPRGVAQLNPTKNS